MKKNILIGMLVTIVLFQNISFTDTSYIQLPSEKLKAYGLIEGDLNGNLNEDAYLTRAELAVILSALRGEKDIAKNFKLKSTFLDVEVSKWYSPYIAYLEAMGLSGGIGNGKYGPDQYVTSQEAAAFLLNVLKVPYSYSEAIKVANGVGIVHGLNTSKGAIKRGDLFEAIYDALYLIPKGEVRSLGNILGISDFIDSKEKETSRVSVKSVVVKSSTEIEVQFSRKVEDIHTLTFNLSRLTMQIPFQTIWDINGERVLLKTSTGLTTGIYQIQVNGLNVGYSENLSIEKQKLSQIEIVGNKMHVVNVDGIFNGYIRYRAFDQYGIDITNTDLARQFVFGTNYGLADGGNGSITLKGLMGSALTQVITVSVADTASEKHFSKELTPELVPCTLSGFNFLIDRIEINNVNRNTAVQVPYVAFDSYGNETKNYDLISKGLQDLNYQGLSDTITQLVPLIITDFTLEVLPDPINSKEAIIQLRCKTTPPLQDQYHVAKAILRAGGMESSLSVIIRK